MTTARHQCQVVVVGTGAGGAVAGAMLAEAGIDTILVEQGGHYTPGQYADVLTDMCRLYLNCGMTVSLGHPPIALPLGRAVGGTTIINSSTCFRPPEEKVRSWRGPSYEEMTPFFEEVEQRINAHVVDFELLGGNGRVMKRGCDTLDIEIRPLMHNVKGCKGSGRCQYGCPEGAKQSTDIAFIPGAMAAGARLLPSHRVDRVLISNRRAAAVTGLGPDGPFEIRADAVVLALGSLLEPSFLLRQKIANGSGRVGRGLTIHPAVRVVAEMDEIVDGHLGIVQGAYIDRWAQRGVMLEGVFMPPGLLVASLPGAGAEYKAQAARYRQLSAFGVMVEDTVKGRVWPGQLGFPFTAYYQMNQADAESMRFGIARVAEIYFAAGAKRVFTNYLPMPVIESRDALVRFETMPVKPAHLELMGFHPLGTCAMGADPRTSVVDFSLETHDLKNLFIMDGSVVPCSLGVNPQITVMALAMRAAKLLANRLHA